MGVAADSRLRMSRARRMSGWRLGAVSRRTSPPQLTHSSDCPSAAISVATSDSHFGHHIGRLPAETPGASCWAWRPHTGGRESTRMRPGVARAESGRERCSPAKRNDGVIRADASRLAGAMPSAGLLENALAEPVAFTPPFTGMVRRRYLGG